jgi:pimeloyl-ACP methyl ester carboxylesterase
VSDDDGTTELREEKVAVASGRVVRCFTGGRGRPLVYLHPASGVTADDRFALALAERFRVVAPVAPGFDDLAELDDVRDVHDVALAYDDLLAALDLGPVAVVGHSLGGMFAAELAAHAPHRVASLVLVAPVGLWDDEHPVLDIFATPPAELLGKLWADPAGEAARAGLGGRPPVTPEEGVEEVIRLVQGLVTAGKFMIPIPDKGLARRLYRITMPTLLLWGARDGVVPPVYAERFAAGLPEARAKILDDAGHMVTLERTDAVVKAIRKHVKRAERAGRG